MPEVFVNCDGAEVDVVLEVDDEDTNVDVVVGLSVVEGPVPADAELVVV